ncbi:class I SAM-dependent methyltransferase [Clostridium botulinum]|uniref:class I SAM-dependent methyltransferase n=1 Tax=Clostridium botulinum TaxID=1491 RepID=UPI0021AE382C|nr:class I SAM-dependent methyltransferase [Clostridium botulinum]UZP02595.1 class I SAM-dependent methyltransferase [Clostridium botulinum]UZP05953.1 class I SAM-dependent methyltransferase [Clostridium botulinum]UZP09334.1 class I SAM-dependent methyltransferase [Clostridium botulinum]
MKVLEHNRKAWDKEVSEGNVWTIPVTSEEVANAKNGEYKLVLTPTKAVPKEWIGDIKNKKVLCLASGGGQQGPIFAALGAEVTVLDNCNGQLEKDRMVAERDNLTIKLEQGDMRDLSRFENESFDFIFHPVSNAFVDNIDVVWKECYRVLKKGGVLIAGFGNPIIYIFDLYKWENEKKLEVAYSIPYSDLEQLPKEQLEERINNNYTIEFGHTLESQIGGQIEAGFAITGFYEDNAGGDLLDKYIDTFIATRAIKL